MAKNVPPNDPRYRPSDDLACRLRSRTGNRHLEERTAELLALANQGDRAGIIACLGKIIPDYAPPSEAGVGSIRGEDSDSPEAEAGFADARA